MQIRATVKWRQSLPLTRAAANHPLVLIIPPPHLPPSPLDPRGCFSFSLTAGTPSSLAPPQLALLIFTPRPRRRQRRRHRHTKSRGWKYAPSRQFDTSNASAPGRTTRYIYAPRFHWKILVPLEEPHGRRPTYEATHPHRPPSPSSSSPGMPPASPVVAAVLGKRARILYLHPATRATKMVVKTLYRFVFLPGNDLRASSP